jgi:hypothetical protein
MRKANADEPTQTSQIPRRDPESSVPEQCGVLPTPAAPLNQHAEGIFAMKHAKELDFLLVIWFVAKAHTAALKSRRAIRKTAQLSNIEFYRLLQLHSISPPQVASL